MSLFTSAKTTCLVLLGAILLQAAFHNQAFGQGSSGTSSPASSSAGISGMDVQTSQLVSKSNEMPSFRGFERLDKTIYIGGIATYFPERLSTGTRLSSGTQQSSGNTRAMTTGSRTTRNTMGNRNMATMNMGRGGVGTNTNTIRSVTSLGYSFEETIGTIRPPEAVRAIQIENRVNNESRINAIVPITVEIENTTAILRGVVANERERKFLEQFVKMEPGIYRVQNELTLPVTSE